MEGINVSSEGTRGGLSIGWRQGLNVHLRSFSVSHIDFWMLGIMMIRIGASRDLWTSCGSYETIVLELDM